MSSIPKYIEYIDGKYNSLFPNRASVHQYISYQYVKYLGIGLTGFGEYNSLVPNI